MASRNHNTTLAGNFCFLENALHLGTALVYEAFFFLVSAAAAAPSPSDTKSSWVVTDKQISSAIEGVLLRDPGVAADNVDIATDVGIVTLSGTVSHLLAKDRAARLAETVKGVRAVIDDLEVMPVNRADAILKQEIHRALRSAPATESSDLNVFVRRGVATLVGTVQSAQEKHLAAKVARSVKGL